jgi:hypothetical protein
MTTRQTSPENLIPRREETWHQRLCSLASRARLDDIDALRELHFADATDDRRSIDEVLWQSWCEEAAPVFQKLLFPHQKANLFSSMRTGKIDFYRLHCLALDRLPQLLHLTLPYGEEVAGPGGTWCWLGSHPDRPEIVRVELLVGTWDEPNTGKSGRDLVSFFGHMFGLSPGRAAHEIAKWMGAEVRAHAA